MFSLLDPALFSELWHSILAAGLPAALMAIAVWHLNKSNSALITELNREREERLDAMEAHISKLQDRSDSCERDRLDLHKQLATLLAAKTGK